MLQRDVDGRSSSEQQGRFDARSCDVMLASQSHERPGARGLGYR